MRNEDGRVLAALDRVQTFLDENRSALGTAVAPAVHEHVAATRAQLVASLTAQDGLARAVEEAVVGKKALRERLVREHLRPIAAVAVARLPEVGELNALRVAARPTALGALLTASGGVAESAGRHEAALVAAGRPSDFIAQLVGAADALRVAQNAQTQVIGRRVEASKALRNQARSARRTLRMVDTLVRVAISGDDPLLARWKHLRRVRGAGTSAPATEQPTAPDSPSSSRGDATPAGGGSIAA